MVRSHALYPTELRAQYSAAPIVYLCSARLARPEGLLRTFHVLRPAGAIARSLSRRSSNVQNRSRRFCRTSDLMVRSHALYPTELRAQCSVACASPPDSPRGWRRERDSNPRWALDPYTLSRGRSEERRVGKEGR